MCIPEIGAWTNIVNDKDTSLHFDPHVECVVDEFEAIKSPWITNYPTMANSSHVRSFSSRWFPHWILHYNKSIIWEMRMPQDMKWWARESTRKRVNCDCLYKGTSVALFVDSLLPILIVRVLIWPLPSFLLQVIHWTGSGNCSPLSDPSM